MPASGRCADTPASTPSDGSAGVDGVLTRNWAPRCVVDEEQVGEGTADIDSEPVRHLDSFLR